MEIRCNFLDCIAHAIFPYTLYLFQICSLWSVFLQSWSKKSFLISFDILGNFKIVVHVFIVGIHTAPLLVSEGKAQCHVSSDCVHWRGEGEENVWPLPKRRLPPVLLIEGDIEYIPRASVATHTCTFVSSPTYRKSVECCHMTSRLCGRQLLDPPEVKPGHFKVKGIDTAQHSAVLWICLWIGSLVNDSWCNSKHVYLEVRPSTTMGLTPIEVCIRLQPQSCSWSNACLHFCLRHAARVTVLSLSGPCIQLLQMFTFVCLMK